jgi:hypothetical protein
VRAPDCTGNSDLDNPIVAVSTCAPMQFAPWSADGSSTGYYGYLDPADGYRDPSGGSNPGNRRTVVNGAYTTLSEANAFLNEYRRWVTVCSIPAATVNSLIAGARTDFIVQVLLNVPFEPTTTLTDPLTRTSSKGGRNHFSLRASAGITDVDVFANGRLPMAVAAQGANTTFYLAKVGPEQAGRTLSVEFWNVGDAAASGSIEIQRGAGATGSAFSCSFTRVKKDNGPDTPGASGCHPHERQPGHRIPGQQDDGARTDPLELRLRHLEPELLVRIVFSSPASGGEALDHTVWSAGVVGDPVRLIE